MNTKSGKELSSLGIGTFGIGGRGHRDVELTELKPDRVYVDALVYTLKNGLNFTEISLGYGHGGAARLFRQALDISEIPRENLFITHSLYPRDLDSFETIIGDTDEFYKIMETDYADSTLVTQSLTLRFGEDETFKFLHSLIDSGRTRYVSLSNGSPSWIKKYKGEFGDLFFAHEGHVSFEVRLLQDKGVLDVCDELGVANIIWRPLRRSETLHKQWPLLVELSEKYQKTQSQIILNWMIHNGWKPMVFSTSAAHIDENVAADSFTMSQDDYVKLTDFRLENLPEFEIDWEGEGIDDDIVAASKSSIK